MVVLLEVPTVAALFACLVMIALAYAYKSTLGAVLEVLAGVFAMVVIPNPIGHDIHPLKWIADGITELDNLILAALGAGIKGTEWAYHKMVHYQAYALQEIGHAIGDLAEGTYKALVHALTVNVPRQIAAAIAAAQLGATHALGHLRRDLAAAEHEIATDVAAIRRDLAAAERATGKAARHAEQTAAGAATAAIAATLPRIKGVEHDFEQAAARLRSLGRVLTPAGIIGLVAAAIGRMGLGWVRCGNVKDVGKAVCGMDRGLLDAILADATLILGTVSLVEFAEGMQEVMGAVTPEVRRFWRG